MAKNRGKALSLAFSLLSFAAMSAAQVTGRGPTIGGTFENVPQILNSPLFFDSMTFLLVWIVSYAFMSIVVHVMATMLNNAGGARWGDTLEEVLLGSTGTGAYRQGGSKNLLLWITGLSMVILAFTVPDFLSSVRALIAGFGIGGFWLFLALVAVVVMGFLFFVLWSGGKVLGKGGAAIGNVYDNQVKPTASGAGGRAAGALGDVWSAAQDAVNEAQQRYNQFRGRNVHVQEANKKVDGLLDRAGWTEKPCPSCGDMQPRTASACGSCGYDFYQP
ncbi:MAG: hypothetical protein ABEJ66_02085 [Candidatus Nanohaloarchaea archaeon]